MSKYLDYLDEIEFASDDELDAIIAGKPLPKKGNDDWQITKGLKAGVDQVQGLGGGLVAVAGDLIGSESLEKAGLDIYKKNMDEAQKNAGNMTEFTKLKDDLTPENAFDYLMYTTGNVIPTIVTAALGGGVGGAVAKTVAKKAVAKQIKRKAAEHVAKGVALKEAEKQAAKEVVGKYVTYGAATASIGMETGSIAGDLDEQTGDVHGGTALAFGTVAGIIDVLPVAHVMRRLGVGKPFKDQVVKSISRETLKVAMMEGGTEAVQTVIERAAVKWVDDNKDIFTPEGLDEIVNATAAGFIGGGVMGAPSAAINKLSNPQPKDDKTDDDQHVDKVDQVLEQTVNETPEKPNPKYVDVDKLFDRYNIPHAVPAQPEQAPVNPADDKVFDRYHIDPYLPEGLPGEINADGMQTQPQSPLPETAINQGPEPHAEVANGGELSLAAHPFANPQATRPFKPTVVETLNQAREAVAAQGGSVLDQAEAGAQVLASKAAEAKLQQPTENDVATRKARLAAEMTALKIQPKNDAESQAFEQINDSIEAEAQKQQEQLQASTIDGHSLVEKGTEAIDEQVSTKLLPQTEIPKETTKQPEITPSDAIETTVAPESKVDQQKILKERLLLRERLNGLRGTDVQALKRADHKQYVSVLKSMVRKLFPKGADIQYRTDQGVYDYEHLLTDQVRKDYLHTLPETLKRHHIKLEFRNGDVNKVIAIKKYFDVDTLKDIWDIVVLHENEIRTKIARKGAKGRGYVESQMMRAGKSVPASAIDKEDNTDTRLPNPDTNSIKPDQIENNPPPLPESNLTEQAPSTEGVSVSEEATGNTPGKLPTKKPEGKIFSTEKEAKLSRQFKENPNSEVVAVDEGFEVKKGFKPLSEIKIIDEVKVAETGETVTIEESAEVIWRRMKKRFDTLTKLKECISS